MYAKKFIKIQFFSLCTDLFNVLCIQTLRNTVCELCSVRYIRVCVHVRKHFNRNKEFCSCCSSLTTTFSLYVNIIYFKVFFRTLVMAWYFSFAISLKTFSSSITLSNNNNYCTYIHISVFVYFHLLSRLSDCCIWLLK